MTTATRRIELGTRTRHGRAVNAVAEFLRSNLTVPNIYLEPRAFAASKLDVLAVDRAGAGDLHGVEIKVPTLPASPLALQSQLRFELNRLNANPTHYRYLALPKTEPLLRILSKLQLFSPDGIGRTGILLIAEENDNLPQIELAIKPERYRVPSASMEKIDKFLARSRPDIEVRI